MQRPKPPKDPRAVLERNLARAKRRGTGRDTRASTMVSGRQYAVAVEGTVITFECKRFGHQYKVDMASKRRKIVQRLDAAATRFHYNWWTKEKGGCTGECPVCLKEHEKAEKAKAQP